MRLALQTDYALRTLIFLATRPGRAQISQIAQFFRISSHHVAKAVHRLAREGYIRTIRGVGGGIELARPANDIVLGELILRFEGNLHLLDCVGVNDVCTIQPNCRLRQILCAAERVQIDYLNDFRLSDLVRDGASLVHLPTEVGRLEANQLG